METKTKTPLNVTEIGQAVRVELYTGHCIHGVLQLIDPKEGIDISMHSSSPSYVQHIHGPNIQKIVGINLPDRLYNGTDYALPEGWKTASPPTQENDNSNELTKGEKFIYDWQYDRLGGFKKKLANAMVSADNSNLNQLELGFPEEVGAYKKFSRVKGWWEEVDVRAGKGK